MSLNRNYLANDTEFLVRVKPLHSEMMEMIDFCQDYTVQDWNFYPYWVPDAGLMGNNRLDLVYFWFSDLKDMTLFRLRFESNAAETNGAIADYLDENSIRH